MTIEEKARAYDEALEKAREALNDGTISSNAIAYLQDIFPELVESEDERIRKSIIEHLQSDIDDMSKSDCPFDFEAEIEELSKYIAWLEKQSEKFIPEDINEAALQYVDTCAVDGEITHDNVTEPYWNNHSMMSAYKAGWLEKQGEQIPANSAKTCKDEQKSNPCDGCVNRKGCINCENGELRETEQEPTNKIEEEYNGEDYGIDSLFHAQRILEQTLGEVDGYQTDDGILSHKCAISVVKKLYEKKSAKWGEDDEELYQDALDAFEALGNDLDPLEDWGRLYDWLKSIKQRMEE